MTVPRLRIALNQAKYSLRIWRALRSGPPFTSSLDRIIIDLTHCCDLSCPGCNRSCGLGQAPASEFIGLDQVERFIGESIAAGKRWRRIMLEGGEPTMHPALPEILAALRRYRDRYSPDGIIEICTNGWGEAARRLCGHPPAGVRLKNSAKSPRREKRHIAFNVAPIDREEFSGAEFSQGCYIHAIFGLGLTRHGYYPHPVCGAIDRIFGFDVGIKNLAAVAGGLHGQMARLCPRCGHFREFRGPGKRPALRLLTGCTGDPRPDSMSRTWRDAYASYRREPPRLSLY